MRIALTGNPNSGKTTMYNALTGRNEKIGNWGRNAFSVIRLESGFKIPDRRSAISNRN